MLMLLGYYDTILKTINQFIDALIAFDVQKILVQCGILIPFGIGVVIGIFLIAKLIEFIFMKAEIHAYYAIIGLILASPIAIFVKSRLERTLCIDDSSRNRDILSRMVYSKSSLAENKN